MRTAVIVAAALLLVIVSVGNALPPGPAKISLQATRFQTRQLGLYQTARAYRLFNRPAYTRQIGTAVQVCTLAVKGWVVCRYFVRLSRGEIIAESLIPTAAGFQSYAVIGGTGYYSNVGGTLTVQPLGADTQLILVVLEAF